MKYNLPDNVLRNLIAFAKNSHMEQLILFGSRAKGTHTSRSDIDLAVSGGDFDTFYWMVQDQDFTLLMFDVINLNENISENLAQEIKQNGVILYEKESVTGRTSSAWLRRRSDRLA